ncbi:hypothetical protein Tsubulata_032272 [Turnera subulata]|uniref:DUF4283 domain-containing protein n=1 Tax=Turnera subulata TaxID=218843 RepID=A0A9Q0JFY9_9ROSI|nr:hypothetical protein Tsubulata_032272 [Turnera subulata]
MEEQVASYKDKLTRGPSMGVEDDAWLEEEEAEYEDGDICIIDGENGPEVELWDAFISRLQKSWKRAVILKVLGRNVGYMALKNKLQSLWKPTGPYRVIDIENNYFVARFANDMDYENVLLNGPWLPLGRYHSRILCTLGDLVGRTVKIDQNTAKSRRGRLAKVAVAIDLKKPVKDTVILQKEEIKVSYEGLPLICQSCDLIGHNPLLCPTRHANSSTDPQPSASPQEQQGLPPTASEEAGPSRPAVQVAPPRK